MYILVKLRDITAQTEVFLPIIYDVQRMKKAFTLFEDNEGPDLRMLIWAFAVRMT